MLQPVLRLHTQQHELVTMNQKLPRIAGSDFRRVANPEFVSQGRHHFHKPLTVPCRLHADPRWHRKLAIKTFHLSRRVDQLPLLPLSCGSIPTNLLPTRVKITSN
jgi:hypothetical protein